MQTKPQIEVQLRRVYGNERFYPLSEDAKLICELLEAQTMTKDQLRKCKNGGWNVMIKTEEYVLD